MLRTLIIHKHAKLFRQCSTFWPRNRLSRERMTAAADAKNRSLLFINFVHLA